MSPHFRHPCKKKKKGDIVRALHRLEGGLGGLAKEHCGTSAQKLVSRQQQWEKKKKKTPPKISSAALICPQAAVK